MYVARGLVENVKTWRKIQERFSELLNGLITELDQALKENHEKIIIDKIHTIKEGYEGKRLAIETEIKKSKI